MANSIVRFLNWLRIDNNVTLPTDVLSRPEVISEGNSGGVAVAVSSRVSVKIQHVINHLVVNGQTPATAADAAEAFYAVHKRPAERDEIHWLFVGLDELGFIAE